MRSYVASFNSARARVAGALDERTLSFVLLRGCRPDLRQDIALQNPQGLNAHISAAVLVADLARETPANPGKRADRVDRPAKAPTPSTQVVVCAHCKKSGHTVDRCFALHPELRKIKRSPEFIVSQAVQTFTICNVNCWGVLFSFSCAHSYRIER